MPNQNMTPVRFSMREQRGSCHCYSTTSPPRHNNNTPRNNPQLFGGDGCTEKPHYSGTEDTDKHNLVV